MPEVNTDYGELFNIIGRIKKHYKDEPYNPFKAMDYVFEVGICHGHGHTVTMVGHHDLFLKETLRAMWHVQRDRGILKEGDKPQLPDRMNEVTTHTGTIVRFVGLSDNSKNQQRLEEICKESTVTVLCSEYKEPVMRNIIRSSAATRLIYDVSKNNL